MKRTALLIGLILGVLASSLPRVCADVIITEPTGGSNVSADKALNSTNGAAFTALGNIVIAEGAATDFAAGTNQTLILTVPSGWQFNPGAGTVSFTGLRNITAAAISVTSSNLTVTFSVNGIDKLDTLTIGGLQVQALDGANLAAADYIRNLFDNSGTADIVGIEKDFTTFGLLNEVAGLARALLVQTQPGSTASAAAPFSPQPEIQVVDQFLNLRELDNTTVVTAARAAGSGTLQGTLTSTAIFGVASYTNLSMNVAGTMTIQFSAPGLTSVTSEPVVVGPALADHLVFTTQPGSASAGVPFGIQPVIKTRDQFGSDSTVGLPASQLVTVTLSSGAGTLSGSTTLDIGTAAGNGTVAFTDLQISTAGTNKQLTASSTGLGNAVSATFAVSSAVFSKLQLLVPGETAAPGTATGKTGTPNPQAAGTPFNVIVNAVDADWNLVNTIADTVGLTSSDSNATLPANSPLVSGTKTFSVTLNSVGGQTLTASDFIDGSKTANTSSTITVGGGTPRKLTIQTQPSNMATAGVPFAQQPVIRVEDAGGNLVATDNGRVITVARGAGTAALQGTLNATTVNGVATFTNLSHNVANTINLIFSGSGLTNITSSNILVSPAAFSQLQLLVPGEAAAPGTASGKSGTPSGQTVGASFQVTVNAVDGFWNLVNTVSHTVGLSSSDGTATLPAATALAAGTTNLTVTFNATGNFTLTATDLTDGSKNSSTSPAIAVSPAQYTAATGGTAISADGATGTFTSLSGPSYSENASGNVGTGTIILNAPPGFVFDTGGTAPTVLVTRLAGSGSNANNINDVASGTAVAMTSMSSTQLVFTVIGSSASGVTCKLTWQNVRVRPTAGTPLASGSLTRSGTASVAGLPSGANLGVLREVPGSASRLTMQTQPSATAMAGVAFAQQPVIRLQDQFGNFCTNNSSTVVNAARGAGSGTLQGTTNRTAVAGLVTFTNLSHNVATNITLAFSASGASGTNSSIIALSAAAADRLLFTIQPGSTTYGSALSPQPVLKTRDPFGNDSTVGLGTSKIVNLSLSGSGSLLGVSSLDIGTAAGNGTVSFSGLQVSMAGTNKQLSATATGLSSALSSAFDVAKATVTGSITANNKVYDGTTAATIATRTLSGVVGSDDVSLSGGSASFATKTAGTAKTVTASGLSLSGLNAGNYQLASTSASTTANITARSLTVSAAGVNKAYDGTTSATVTLSDNRIAGDSLSTTYSTASFADKNIGTAKNVSVSGISISGTDAPNYSANTTASTTANITARSLTISATGVNKVYDGTTSATVTLSDNRLAGDSLSSSYTNASFATKSVGTNKTVSVSGITLSGTDAANYTFNSTATTTANISARSLTVSATANNKVYDASTSATVTLSDNRVAGDSLASSYTNASFANKNVGAAKTVSISGIALSGADAVNYSANTTASTTADITARSLTISATGVNKAYDGTTSATVTLSDNRIAGDSLSTTYSSASFADKNVGIGKNVSVSGISISGTDAANYSANSVASTTANITARSLTISATGVNKVYDGTTSATVTLSDNRLAGDSLSSSYTNASFATKSVGTNKTVSVSGITLSGIDAANYTFNSTATTTANITARSLTVSAAGINRVYNGTTSATVTLSDNRLAGDSLSTAYSSASFADKNVGTGKNVSVSGISLSGTDAPNYTANTTASTTADITARSLTVSATGLNKVYDATTDATVTLSDNRLAGDSLSTTYSSASFATKSVGTNKTVSVSGITLSGADAPNYSANTSASATANISARGLTVSGLSASDKVYDASTSASLNTASAALVGVLSGDSVSLNTAGAAGAFADKNAGTGKVVNVSALSLSGVDASNYTLTQPSTTASITKAGLTVTADNKTRAAGQANPTLSASYSGFVGGETLPTSGVTGSPALSTTSTNVAGTYPITAAQGTLSASNYSFSFVNGVLTVTPASASSLVILTQPSSTATAGMAFVQQPAIAIQDAYGNLRSSDSSTVITAARSAGTGTLQGTLSATAVNGVATFANLSHNVANTINLIFSGSGLTNITSSNILVSPAAFSQLQLLVPGETAAPGTASGKSGTPSGQTVGASFQVTVNAVDGFWNLVNTVTDLVGVSSSDAKAFMPGAVVLASGTQSVSIVFGTAGSQTISVSDLTDASRLGNTSSGILVNASPVTPATGGTAISADATGATYTNLVGPAYSESISGDIGTGTIILNAPAGFVFDTGGVAPTVLITRISGTGNDSKNINGVASGTSMAMTSVTATQLVFTVTASSSGPVCSLTWQSVRVRPKAGTPLASGIITKTGTATLAGVAGGSSFGALREVAGAANKLAIQTQASSTATAGAMFAQQPVIGVQDKFGNLRTPANGNADNSTVVSAARNGGSGSLQGSLSARAAGGLATFTNLFHTVATNITIAFSSGSLSNTTSSAITISPAAAAQLVFVAQPGNGVVGSPLSAQPILRSRDQFGNLSAIGLGANKQVTLTLSAGTGPLLGVTSVDIGTNAGNGVVACSDLEIDSAGTNKQLTASASGLSNAVSVVFSVAKADQNITFGPLSNKTYGDPSFILSATASSGLPVTFSIVAGPATVSGNTLTATGSGSVTVRASQSGDANCNAAPSVNQSFSVAQKLVTGIITVNNKIYDGTTSATIAMRSLSGVVGSDNVSLTGGAASFADKNAANGKTVMAAGLSLSGGSAGNYQLASTSVATTADILPATITVTADNKSKVYGAPVPSLTASYSGFVNAENQSVLSGSPSLSTTANANSSVNGSPYPISVAVGTLSAANYTFSFVNGTLAVTKAMLMVTADDVTRAYGEPNPAFTAIYAGFVNNDNTNVLSGAAQLSTVADIDSPAGSYPITAANGTLSATNYDFTFIAGQLTITEAKPAQPATLTGIEFVANGVKITFTASASLSYRIERAPALQSSGTAWTNIGSATTDAAGQGGFTDTNPIPSQGFYRVVSP